jgi:GEVED domain/Secretion system C-terminal sorting domain
MRLNLHSQFQNFMIHPITINIPISLLHMKKLIFVLPILALLLSQRVFAQPSFDFSPAILEVDEDEAFCLDLKVQDFTDLIGIQFTVKFDPAVLEFDHFANLNANTTGLDINDFNTSTAGMGYITLIWSDGQPCQGAVGGVTLPDAAVLFSICFRAKGQYGMHTPVYFASSPVEMITKRAAAQCIDIGEYTTDGFVSIGTTPLKIDISSANGNMGENVCIDFKVRDFQDLVSVRYFIFYDPAILEFVPNSLLKMNLDNAGDPYDVSHNSALHMISSNWHSPTAQAGVSLPNGTQVLQACFKIIGNCGQVAPIYISDNPFGTPPEQIVVMNESSSATATNIGIVSTPGKVTVNCPDLDAISINMDDKNACPGETFTVDVKVEDFSHIIKLKFDLRWNPAVIEYQSVQYPTQPGSNCLPWSTGFNAADATTMGLIHMDWSIFGQGCNKPDGYILFRLTFKVVGPIGSGTNISVVDPIFVDKFGAPVLNIGINANNSYVQACGPIGQTINFPPISNQSTAALPIALNATASSGLPVSYEIVSGPATILGNTLTVNGVPGTVTVRATQAGNAQYLPATDVLVSFTVSAPSGSGYCTSSGVFPWHEWISRLQFGAINHISGKRKYSNFTSISTSIERGATYPLSVTVTYSYTTYDEYCRIWIDYNANAIFEDTEIAYEGILVAPPSGLSVLGTFSGNILVPMDAALGNTRMRVSVSRGAYVGACGQFANGEVEDYTVSIADNFQEPPFTGMEGRADFDYRNSNIAQAAIGKMPDIQLYPNPASDAVNIQLAAFEGQDIALSAYDGIGHLVYHEKIDCCKLANHQFVTSNWQEGVYTLVIDAGNSPKLAYKILIMR